MRRETPLLNHYMGLGAEIGEFAGWRSPLWFTSAREEHLAVRSGTGVFDITHMTRIALKGPRAEETLQKNLTIKIEKVKPGRMKYCLMCNERGGIVDDLTVFRFQENGSFVIVSNALTHDKVIERLGEEAEDLTFKTALFAVQGPGSLQLVERLTGLRVEGMKWFSGREIELMGLRILLTRSGYTGENGYEFLVWSWDEGRLKRLWDKIVELGATPCGLAARDSLRLEAAYPLYGEDMDEETTPIEARLIHAVDLSKPWFIGKEAVEKVAREKPKRLLVGLRMVERGVPRREYRVLGEGGEVLGEVTSGGFSFTLGIGIALGYVRPDYAVEGEQVKVDIRGKPRKAEVTLAPFVPHRMK